jgi:hypothetical protein
MQTAAEPVLQDQQTNAEESCIHPSVILTSGPEPVTSALDGLFSLQHAACTAAYFVLLKSCCWEIWWSKEYRGASLAEQQELAGIV